LNLYGGQPGCPLFVEETYECHVLETEELRYYVRRVPRRKRKRSRIIRGQRRGNQKDSRAWKYVLVGVQHRHGGGIRLASRDDVGRFTALTRSLLWEYPLIEVPDTNPKNNPSSHPRYWDTKILGYLLASHGDQIVAGPTEQITTTLVDHVSSICTRGGESHVLYEGRRIRDDIAPVWFAHRPIDWKSPAVKAKLQTHWESQLPALHLWRPA
jgi:hypothetical protein